jgi:dTDP-4-amino-4,6-dideoxygalactose transaminase
MRPLAEPSRASTTVAANDFARQWDEIREGALAAVERVGSSGWLILGEEVSAFEAEIAGWWGIAHAVGVGSGLDALEIALRCAEVGPDAKVLTTPFTAFATSLAIIRAGSRPVWCDVDESGGLDLEQAEAALRSDPLIRAIVPVHLYGHPLDGSRLAQIAAAHDAVLIEDCAQSAGATRDGAPTGRAGLAAATSLYPTKNLGALGDGGVLLTDDAELAARAKRLRNYGQGAHYEHTELGLNSRLDELHAAILRSALLPRLDGWLTRRRQIATRYTAALMNSAGTLRPVAPTGGDSACHLFPVEVMAGEPAEVTARLRRAGVAVGRHYPFVCPDQPAAQGRGEIVGGGLPVARRLARRTLSLPIHPHLTDFEVERVIDACIEASA